MNKIIQLQDRFKSGDISKHEYIDTMYEKFHSILFNYSSLIQSTDISKIEIADNRVIMTLRDSGVQLIVNENDKRSAPLDVLNFNNYEKDEIEMQLQLMEGCHNIFDIGSNIGWYSIYISKNKADLEILSFEPISGTYNSFLENIKINDTKNIQPFNFGFSKEKGSFELYCDPNLSVNASLANVSNSKDIETIVCNIETLDEFTKTKEVDIDFIKCDVEGAELLVFEGGKNAIKKDLPIIFSEMLRKWMDKFGHHPNQLIDLLSDLGYHCFILENKKLKRIEVIDDHTINTNFFFLHHQKHSDKITKFSS